MADHPAINSTTIIKPNNNIFRNEKTKGFWNEIRRNKYLYLLALPGVLYFILFKYLPIWGVLIAFQDYSPFLGYSHSKWIGIENFQRVFMHQDFLEMFRNTLTISLINLIMFFPLPIILSLMLNELRSAGYKKFVQSVIYIPHFLSWVIVYALTYLLFSQSSGVVNTILMSIGVEKIDVLTNTWNYWFVLALQNIWKETGWGTIVILAALAGVNLEMYEAAKIDGAGRLRTIWSITLPSITNIIVILLVLRLGQIMEVGFEQSYLMANPLVMDVANVFDLFAYNYGILQGDFSFATAVGLFKSVIGLIMIIISNIIAKKLGHSGVY